MLCYKKIKSKIQFLIFVFIVIFYLYKTFSQSAKSTIVLYRIIGNDLPPRHSSNQTLTNLLFTLQYEPLFTDVTKIWILNRIVDNQTEQNLIQLLRRYNETYIRIPFNLNEYRRIPYFFPSINYFQSIDISRLSYLIKLQLIDTLYHLKNLYVMNNNGARNFALKHGKEKTQANWLAIFDGNCFLSHEGFNQIVKTIRLNGSRIQYIIVPMKRLIDNNQIFTNQKNNWPRATQEPQIIFRRDSTIEFLETKRYGQRTKQELLHHLGLKNYNWQSSLWNPKERTPIFTSFQRTSFIFRLYSGNNPKTEKSVYTRSCHRYHGILFFLDNLDFNLTQRRLLTHDFKRQIRGCQLWSNKQIREIIQMAQHNI